MITAAGSIMSAPTFNLPRIRQCQNCFMSMPYKRPPQVCPHCAYINQSQRKKGGAA